MDLNFKDIDIVRYDALLQTLMDDIKKDALDAGCDKSKAEFLAFSWLVINFVFTHEKIFPKCSKGFFLATIGEFYDKMKIYLDSEEEVK